MLVGRGAAGGAPAPAPPAAPTVRRAEWTSEQRGLQRHARLETTHWSAPQHSYGKMVAGVALRSGGHAVHAQRQVEVLSARAPGVLRVLRATVTTSHTSSTSTRGHRHFDDLQLSVNPLDTSSQRERSSVGRSGALGGRRPPSRGRAPAAAALEGLSSPSIVADGVSKLSTSGSVDIVEMKSDSDKLSMDSDDKKDSGTNYKVNYPDNESEESFYDSCPEKDSIFKDETEQLEEWRRSSKIRRSLQFPRRSPTVGKALDLPDNWGSVSRIKRELENVQNVALFPKNLFHSPSMFSTISSENSVIREEESESAKTDKFDSFIIKPSSLKTKSFISLETLNEVRGRLKTFSVENDGAGECKRSTERDDGIEAEINPPKEEDNSPAEPKVTRVRSYVFGMEAMLNALNEQKQNYPGGSNSLESRVSKMSNASSSRSDDWYMRRKSYGFEKVGNKSEDNSLTSHDKNNIESSTDSGICQSSELVNSLSNNGNMTNCNGRTGSSLGKTEKRETFEDWLQKNRKSFVANIQNGVNKYKLQDEKINSEQNDFLSDSTISSAIKSEESPYGTNNKQLFYRKLSEGTTLSVKSSTESSSKDNTGLFPSKRHTIAVDGIKEIRDLYEPKNVSVTKTFFPATNIGFKVDDNSEDSIEKKSKKVEFCKTEVHFTAESGRVNIVESEGKPPSTNNFRRRRRSAGTATEKETDKSKLPETRFGDNIGEAKTQEIDENKSNSNDKLKLNYAIITEIKSKAKETQNEIEKNESLSVVQINGDLSENDQPRGILKNKPVKPRPYLLGEEAELLPESESAEQNLWGVKLRPVKRVEETPVWKSSVLLNNSQDQDITTDFPIRQSDKISTLNNETPLLPSASEVSKVNKSLFPNSGKLGSVTTAESRGYSTKVNFGNGGDAVIETSFRQQENINDFIKSEGYKEIFDDERNINSYLPESTSPSSMTLQNQNVQRNLMVSEKKQIFDNNFVSFNNFQNDHFATITKTIESSQKTDDKKNAPSFADSISTPRSLMPTRGSARKLKQHELSYFGIKDLQAQETTTVKNNVSTESKEKITRISNTLISHSTNSKTNQRPRDGDLKQKPLETQTESPIYENVIVSKTPTKHPGESIIEELTKAADEILQALNGYSDEESSHSSSGDDGDPRNHKNKKRFSKPLETISETFTHKTKALENKAVQADFGGREKYKTSLSTTKRVGTKNSSNSSIESIVREPKSSSHKVKSKILEAPEKPQRRKVSSVEAVKARRLHRANSRDALLQIHGSSSEDLPGNIMEVVKKKSSRRSKYGDVRNSSNSSLNIHQSSASTILEESKDNKYPTRSHTTILPEIRHRTAVSTIKAVSNESKDKSSNKTKSSSKERSRRRDKLQEGTISSLNRMRGLVREKSRSADTSLDRESGYQRERIRSKDTASYHGDENLDPIKIRHSSSHHRSSHQNKVRSKEPHRDESHDKAKVEETSSPNLEKAIYKITRDHSSDRRDRAHSKTRVRESSSNRRDRSQEAGSKDQQQGEIFDEKSRITEKSSHHREQEKSRDKHRERDLSSHRRDRSQDSSRFRAPEIKYEQTKKKHAASSGVLGGVSSPARERQPRAILRPHKTAKHTRTEHDKSLR